MQGSYQPVRDIDMKLEDNDLLDDYGLYTADVTEESGGSIAVTIESNFLFAVQGKWLTFEQVQELANQR